MPAARQHPGRTLVVFGLGVAVVFGLVALTGVWTPRLGLDLEGGTRITLTAEEGTTAADLTEAVEVVDARLNAAGVSEAEVTTQADRSVVVELPGQSRGDLVSTLQRTSRLGLRLVARSDGGPGSSQATALTVPRRVPGGADGSLAKAIEWVGEPDQAALAAYTSYRCPPDGRSSRVEAQPGEPLVTCDENGVKYLLSPAVLDGGDLDDASAVLDKRSVQPTVRLDFDDRGAERFAAVSDALFGTENRYAMVLDGHVASAPTVRERVEDGRAQISGELTQAQARSLATGLDHGPLPVDFAQDPAVETVGPTLAGDQVRAGLVAGLAGLVVALGLCLILYRRFGLVLVASLLVSGLLAWGVVLLLSEGAGLTLTLPGITGLLVGLGVAADSTILLLARVRDALRDGGPLPDAVESGRLRARRTSLAANGVLLLAAVVLHLATAGVVRGFALTLGVAAVVDLVVLLCLTGPLLAWLSGNGTLRGTPDSRTPVDGPNIDVVGARRRWLVVSGLLVLVAVVGLGARGLDPGVEFVGGAEYRISIPAGQVTASTAEDLRETVAGTGIENAANPVVATTSGGEALLLTTESLSASEEARVTGAIARATGATASDISSADIDASWAGSMTQRLLLGLGLLLVLALLLIGGYFRDARSMVAALVAVVHDVLITLGVYALAGFDVSPATVTGLLAVVGFSLYNAVVVLDRVRENAAARPAGRSYADAAELAVNQSLVRAAATGVVALLPVAAVLGVSALWFGTGSLKDLALTLFVGMAAGLYSSLFVAPPLLARLRGDDVTDAARAERDEERRRTSDPYAVRTGRRPMGTGRDGRPRELAEDAEDSRRSDWVDGRPPLPQDRPKSYPQPRSKRSRRR